ncbi:MAG: precorrin-3B C(17)-methyltransferase [Pseudomonadota bacterium]
MPPLILILGEQARSVAGQIKAEVGGEVFVAPPRGAGEAIRAAFREGRTVIGICAAGILIRALGSLTMDKHQEPPVIAVSADGRTIVPLLGGHRGANAIAIKLAEACKGFAAITTASETILGLALDEPPAGWRIAPNPDFHHFVAARLDGRPCRLSGEAEWLQGKGLEFDNTARDEIIITHEDVHPTDHRLVYHPPLLALGVGTERGTPPDDLHELVHTVLHSHDISAQALAGVFSLDLKSAEPAVHVLADRLGIPVRFFSAEALEAEAPRLANPSDLVFAETGCHGVAEGAALAAGGRDAKLLVEKTIGQRCTCAIALAPQPIDADTVGRPQGRLAVLGIGPGTPEWRTSETVRHIRQAQDIVGYGLYLDLIKDLIDNQRLHTYALGEEAARCRFAIDLAAQGRRVVLVSSGDAGIYGMATLVTELLATADNPAWARIDLRICPGISAMQAAAARAGAPLGHDFCAISLSDLMTPWPVIETRIKAAADADFVLALYNPVSARRREGFEQALSILRVARPPTTPVVLARNLGRSGETVANTCLGELHIDQVDMLTIIIVGNHQTQTASRLHGPDWVFTPRGYTPA